MQGVTRLPALVLLAVLALALGAGSAHADRYHDGYSGATDAYSGATDGYSGATRKDHGWRHRNHELERRQRRALRRFERRRERDYRRLENRRFRSEWARERAFRELEREHEARLRQILGESRYNEEYRRYDDNSRRGYDRPEDAVIHLILREILDR